LVQIGASEVNPEALFENKDKFTLSLPHGTILFLKSSLINFNISDAMV
jgi:hypothetical protein